MRLNLRNCILTEEFDYGSLKQALSAYKNPRVKINDLLKKGHIIRVKKGLYVFGPELARGPYVKESLANLIYGPSYISLEYALYFYGLIPERVETVTSVTDKRKKLFNTPVGIFSYRYIHPSLYPHGVTLYKMDQYHSILLASREKAICDMLYFSDDMADEAQIEAYFLRDLRMELAQLRRLNIREARKLSRLYGHNARVFSGFLEKIK